MTALDPCFRNFLTENQKNCVKDYLKERAEHMQSLQQHDEEDLNSFIQLNVDTSPPSPKKIALDKLLGDEEQELSSDHEVDMFFSKKLVACQQNS